MTPADLAVLLMGIMAVGLAVRILWRRKTPPQIVPLVEGDTIDGYCGFCGEEGHKALNCTALDGVVPAVIATAYGPAGGKGCTGDHDPVPVVVGEGDPLVEPEEPVGYLCSKCLASVTEDGKGFAGAASIMTGSISADRITAGTMTFGKYTKMLDNGTCIEVYQENRDAATERWRWRVRNTADTATLLTGADGYADFNDALRAACDTCGIGHSADEVRVHGRTEPVKTIVTGVSSAVAERNLRAYAREAKWAHLIVYDPANLPWLKAEHDRVTAAAQAMLDHYPSGQMTEPAKDQLQELIEEAEWLRATIRQEEARREARWALPMPGPKSLVEAEGSATAALGLSQPRGSLVQALVQDRGRLAKTMDAFADSPWSVEQQKAWSRMQEALRQLDRAIEFHSNTARLAPPSTTWSGR